MKNTLKHFFALHVSLAYLGMLTGFGMILSSLAFVYLLMNDLGLPMLFHSLFTYLTLITGPGAIALSLAFYHKIRQSSQSLA